MSTIPSVSGAASAPASGPVTYADIQQSQEFKDLRRSFRRFVFPMTGLFLAWYFLYVLLAAFAPGFMSNKVGGNINVGLLFGFGQFLSTFLITWVYVRWAGRRLDPAAAALRARFEGDTGGAVNAGDAPAGGEVR